MQPNDDQQPAQLAKQPQSYAPPVQPAPQQVQDQPASDQVPLQKYVQPQATPTQQPQPVEQPTVVPNTPQYAQPTADEPDVSSQSASAPTMQALAELQLDMQPEQQTQVQSEQPVFPQPAPEVAYEQPQASTQPDSTAQLQQSEQLQSDPALVADQTIQPASVAPVTWQAQEYLQQDKPPLWYVLFAGIVLVFMGVAIWLQAWTFAVLIPIMAAALAVYAHRPPRVVNYSVSEKGLTINGQLHPMGEFKSFGVLKDSELHALMLVPVKRFRPGITLYFPDEVGEPLVDMLGAYLPMQDLHIDMVDKIIQKLRI